MDGLKVGVEGDVKRFSAALQSVSDKAIFVAPVGLIGDGAMPLHVAVFQKLFTAKDRIFLSELDHEAMKTDKISMHLELIP